MPRKFNYFKLISPVMDQHVRNFTPADTDLLDPTSDEVFVDGEFLTLDSDYHVKRATGSDALVFPIWYQIGAYDVQAIQKVPVIFTGGTFEAATRLYVSDPTAVLFSGSLYYPQYSVGALLKVYPSVTHTDFGTYTKSGLITHFGTSADTDYVIGVVTKTPSDGWLTFKFFANPFKI